MTPFSIVVVLHDSAGPLPALLASLGQLPSPPQLIVVDTASSDEGPALARAAGAEVVVLGENLGFGAANNVGVERAEHPVTVLLNPDCELLDGSLALLAARATGGELWVPRLLNPDGSLQRSAYPLPGTVGALLPAVVHPPILPEPLLERVEPFRSERARSVGWAIAACVAASTETLRRLGPSPYHRVSWRLGLDVEGLDDDGLAEEELASEADVDLTDGQDGVVTVRTAGWEVRR